MATDKRRSPEGVAAHSVAEESGRAGNPQVMVEVFPRKRPQIGDQGLEVPQLRSSRIAIGSRR
jgi:hypothetical protein